MEQQVMSASSRDWALSLAFKGIRIVPIVPGTKMPRVADWPNQATTDPATINSWYDRHPTDGVGIATGRYLWSDGTVRCLIAFDVDMGMKANKKTGQLEPRMGWENWCDIQATYGEMPPTVEANTGGGGKHYLYWLPPGLELGVDNSGKIGQHIDYRCIGGQILVEPTIHMDTQVPYHWVPGRSPLDFTIAEVPPAFCEYLRVVCDASPRTAKGTDGNYANRRSDREIGTSPIDQYLAQYSWKQVLEAAGWEYRGSFVDQGFSGEFEGWMRPGGVQTSASLYHGGSDVLYNFSTNAEPIEPNKSYSKEGFVATVWYGGDFSKLKAHCESLGFVDHRQVEEDAYLALISEAIDLRHGKPKPTASVPVAIDDPWPELQPIKIKNEAKHFPIEALGGWLQSTVRGLAESLNVPEDVPAAMALSVLSLLAMPKVKLHLSRTHQEPVNLYQLLAYPSGGGKTPCWDKIKRPVELLQTEATLKAQADAQVAAGLLQISEARMRLKLKNAAGPDGDAEAESSFLEEAIRADGHRKAASNEGGRGQMFGGDATGEALAMLLAANNGCFGVMDDEGSEQLGVLNGRYSDNPSIGPLLKGFSGSRYTQNRVGRDDLIIENTVLTVMLAIQPGVLAGVLANTGWEDRGLTARMLIIHPRQLPTIAEKHHLLATDEMEAKNAELERVWTEQITALYRKLQCYEGRDSYQLNLDRSARAMFAAWESSKMMLTDEGEPQERMRASMKKLTIQVARLSALLHLADGTDGDVDCDAMSRAILIGEYWLSHANQLTTLSYNLSIEVTDADRISNWIRGKAKEGITSLPAADVRAAHREMSKGRWEHAISTLRNTRIREGPSSEGVLTYYFTLKEP